MKNQNGGIFLEGGSGGGKYISGLRQWLNGIRVYTSVKAHQSIHLKCVHLFYVNYAPLKLT